MNIPLEIVEDILQKLPLESIIRFKILCKAWNSLISDPKFKKRHFSKQSIHQKILLSSPSGFRSLDPEKSSITRLNFPLTGDRNLPDPKIVGSSNGLVCVTRDNCQDFIIWNPSTGDHRNLPDPKTPLGGSFTYGFGYDLSTDDYKIVIVTDSKDRLYKSRMPSEVFSLRKNSWRPIRDIRYGRSPVLPSPAIDGQVAVTFNGAIHWVLLSLTDRGSNFEYSGNCSIIAFNLENEEAIALATPFICPLIRDNRIVIIDECVCLSFPVQESIEFWAMKEYGEKDSWQKLFSIPSESPYYLRQLFGYSPDNLWPLCKATSGEILVIRERKELIEVCFKDNKVRKLKDNIFEDEGGDCLSQASVYVQSLESPFDYI